jgi:hypothetical protein
VLRLFTLPLLALPLWTMAHPAYGITLSSVSQTTPYTGVTIDQYRTSSPTTDVWVATVDLCAAGLRVDATSTPDSLRSASSWAQDVGADLAINGDFYKSGPVRVYGRAVGSGIPWPDVQTGVDAGYSWEWFYEKYGWIALGHDRSDFTHTEWTKDNTSASGGWAPDTVAAAPPIGTLALVSGFPEVVTEGVPVTCSSPTASDCFPDRSDMQARHPRSAMGVTEDGQTLFLVAADGRTSRASGLYGAELADLMHQLGAWQAFNLDGGGSTQLWLRGDGTLNNASGNNGGGSLRGVANHIGVFASGSGRPAHCATEPPCGVISRSGGTIDDDSACFGLFGDPDYWRSESGGAGGHHYWTNAWVTEQPENWAWWRLEMAQGGTYSVDVWAEPGGGFYNQAHYRVVADGVEHTVTADLSTGGWIPLGTFEFADGGDQFVAAYDDAASSPPDDRRVPGDAVRLVREGPWCGDGTCDEGETAETCPLDCDDESPVDTGDPIDTGPWGGDAGDDGGTDSEEDPIAGSADNKEGGRCQSGPGPFGSVMVGWLVALGVVLRRRR